MKKLLVLPTLLLFVSALRADTVTPTFEETLPELTFMGNDVTFLNVTPATLEDAIDGMEFALFGTHSIVSGSALYEADFYADGSAFLFEVPSGTVVGNSTVDAAVSEPSGLMLLSVAIVALAAKKRLCRG